MLDIYKTQEPSLDEAQSVDTKTLYLCPSVAKLPDDGLLNYVTFETFGDLLALPERSVVLLRPDQFRFVKVVEAHGNTVGLDFKVLTGVAEADYSVAFDDVTWSFERIAYAPFIADLTNTLTLESTLRSQKKGAVATEEAAYTRKDGSVKEFTKFDEPLADGEEFKL